MANLKLPGKCQEDKQLAKEVIVGGTRFPVAVKWTYHTLMKVMPKVVYVK